jgi:hypothetical protein
MIGPIASNMKGDGMEDQQTCGKGLAEHAVLPAKMAELMAAIAENLELHREALDFNDSNSKKEYDAYLELAGEHRELGLELQATAKKMADCWDLPMGEHDQHVMSSPKVLAAFQRVVHVEQELLVLLQKRVEQDLKMLREATGATGGAD